MKKVAALASLALVLMAIPAQARTRTGSEFVHERGRYDCETVKAPMEHTALMYCDSVAGSYSGGAQVYYRFPGLRGVADVDISCDCSAGRGYMKVRWIPELAALRVREVAGVGVVYSVSVSRLEGESGPA